LSITQAGELFLEFGSYEHINVPRLDIIEGVIDSQVVPGTYIFVRDRLDGQDLARKRFGLRGRNKAVKVMEGFLTSLADYAGDKYLKGGFYLSDQQHYDQYIYGRRPGDLKDKVYFVDLHPFFGYLREDDNWARRFYAVDMLGFIGSFICSLERRLGGVTLLRARERHKQFADLVVVENPDLDQLKNKKFPYWQHV